MKILITGVAGLIGSRLAEHILANTAGDIDVVGVDNLSGGYMENVPKRVRFFDMDAGLPVIKHLMKGVDYCFCLHAYAAEGLSPFMRTYNYKTNLVTTANVINACIESDVKRLVFTSSMSVYGRGVSPFDENDRRQPIDPYGVSKMACEMDIEIAAEQHGLNYTIIRPHNIIGRNQNIWDKYRNVLGIFLYQRLNGLPLTIYGDGTQVRAFSPIDDCLPALWKSALLPESKQQIINLGGWQPMTINELADLVIDVTGGGKKVYMEARHEVHEAYPTYQKSVDLLNYSMKTGIRECIEDMWVWAQQQPRRDRKEWPVYELDKGIYSYWKK